MTRYGIIGWGRIGRRVATRLATGTDLPVLVAVLARAAQADAIMAELPRAVICTTLTDFIARAPDVAIETASAEALIGCAPALLAAGIDLIPLSLAAFADPAAERDLRAAATTGPGRLEIPAGAMGSLDFLAAAREDELTDVLFRATNSPARWRDTHARALIDLDSVSEPTLFLRDNVRAVARLFPRNLNVAVGVALAGLGLDQTRAELYVDRSVSQARFEVEAIAGPGRASLVIHGRHRAAGEDPVDYTTFSIMRLLRRRDARIAI